MRERASAETTRLVAPARVTHAPQLAAWAKEDPARWGARIDDAPPAALPAGWLDALARATDGRWRSASQDATGDGAKRIELLREGRPLGTLWLARDQVSWCAPGGCAAAPVESGALRGLLDALRR